MDLGDIRWEKRGDLGQRRWRAGFGILVVQMRREGGRRGVRGRGKWIRTRLGSRKRRRRGRGRRRAAMATIAAAARSRRRKVWNDNPMRTYRRRRRRGRRRRRQTPPWTPLPQKKESTRHTHRGGTARCSPPCLPFSMARGGKDGWHPIPFWVDGRPPYRKKRRK